MNKIFLVVLLVVFSSCKNEKKETINPETESQTETPTTQEVVYEKLTDVSSQLNFIFDNGFEFSNDIEINYIALQSKGGDKFQLIYGLDPESNLDKISTLRVSAVFYAENPALFKDKIYQDRKSRQVADFCKVKMLDNEPVLTQEFTVIPKIFTQVKFYFYDDNGVVNDRMLTVRKINMPK